MYRKIQYKIYHEKNNTDVFNFLKGVARWAFYDRQNSGVSETLGFKFPPGSMSPDTPRAF